MPDLDSFMKYELSRGSGKSSKPSNGGCRGGCAAVIAIAAAVMAVAVLFALNVLCFAIEWSHK